MLDGRVDFAELRQIRGQGNALGAPDRVQRSDRVVERLAGPGEHRHAGTLAGKCLRGSTAHAPRAANHQHACVSKSEIHCTPPVDRTTVLGRTSKVWEIRRPPGSHTCVRRRRQTLLRCSVVPQLTPPGTRGVMMTAGSRNRPRRRAPTLGSAFQEMESCVWHPTTNGHLMNNWVLRYSNRVTKQPTRIHGSIHV